MANTKSELESQLRVALDKAFDMTKLNISKGLIKHKNHYLESRIERLSTQIEELMSKKIYQSKSTKPKNHERCSQK